ncbi:MAG: glycoside hydrolase family 97 N-terminal domain-containing protein [Bacteroidaceae bacterium]|nr:glycoside hydrolase family 97 N-terminal domain-containing protein [Bacteroidaceae bacterium]
MKRTIFTILLALCVSTSWAQYFLDSPDQSFRVNLTSNRERKGASKFFVPTRMMMQVKEGIMNSLLNEEIGLTVKSHGKRYAFGKSHIIKHATNSGYSQEPIDELSGRYNSLELESEVGITLEIRVYNTGIAYRFKIKGFYDEYKILEICDVFPNEKSIANLGTLTGEYTLPWRTVEIIEKDGIKIIKEKEKKEDESYEDLNLSDQFYLSPTTKIIPWRDALSSISIGTHFNWYHGDAWKGVAQNNSIDADIIYKYIFAGLGFTPCHEMMYIYYEEDFDPFLGVIGSVHSWTLSGRVGFSLPVQSGYEIWNFSPYLTTSILHLQQHGNTLIGHVTPHPHHYNLMGAGIKIDCALRQRVSLGIGYEYQFFTGKKTPSGRHSFILSLGYLF